MDIVERLRREYEYIGAALNADAADEIESLRQQLAETKEELASCIEDLDREVRVGNDYMSQLAECERERDEKDRQVTTLYAKFDDVTKERDALVAALKYLVRECDDNSFDGMSFDYYAGGLQEAKAALAKVGADKGEES